MKKTITLILILITQITLSQTTAIPDPAFEFFLEMEGFGDGIPNNGLVLTANINTITELDVWDEGISDLTGIEDFTALEILDCSDNFLTSIDVSNNFNLWELDCGVNQITSIIANPNIESLLCYENHLTSLDVSNYLLLDQLWCDYNAIVSLDLSNNINLIEVYCGDNNALTSLDVKNGNNNEIIEFDATNTPNLTCIQVDDEVAANNGDAPYTNWIVDAGVSYSENCNLGVSEINKVKINIYPNPVKQLLFIESDINLLIKSMVVYNLLGVEVYSKQTAANTLDLSSLEKGIYFLKVETTEGSISKRIIKE
jgi:hypothetical protein